jgi:hypothetical protein
MPIKLGGVPSWKRTALLVFVVVPILAWFIVKPVRVIAPQAVGLTCPDESVCVDGLAQLPIARQLRTEALQFVSTEVADVPGSPKIIFCSTTACADSFGLGLRSAVTLGTFGTVIGPRAWKDYYVRHEMIHYLQARQLGVASLLLKPSWFIEGMAYGLSQDPRHPLKEPFEGYRARFLSWYAGIDRTKMWDEGGKL